MKHLGAILAVLVLLPVAVAVGYVAHQDPAPLAFDAYLLDQQNVKHVAGQDTDDWVAMAATGPNKGGAIDLLEAMSFYPSHEALEQSAQGKVVYVERKCVFYSTTGKKNAAVGDKTLVQRCTQTVHTRKQAENYMVTLLAPEPKS